MKIKRYTAASMRAALAQVREEQGPDAVIMSSRRIDNEIEVIAAVDYDEALFAGAVQPKPRPAAVPAAAVEPASVAVVKAPVTVKPAPSAVPGTEKSGKPAPMSAKSAPAAISPVADEADHGYVAVQREVRELRDLLQGELSHLSWNDKRLRNPLQARVLEQLTSLDVTPDVAGALAKRVPQRSNLKNPSSIPLALLVRNLRVVDDLGPVNGGVIALVGPTGVGKTTTIAKLAARWSLQNGSQDLALVSTDSYRIGAREQLSAYARMLGAPMHTANDGKELARVLERLRSKKLILIDTAGMAPRDVRLKEQLAALQLGAARARVLLALPAQGDPHALEEIVRSFERVAPAACVLTKIDEAASLGAIISTVLRHELPIAYLCNGQRVPEDLHSAYERRVWLVKAAVKLKQRMPTRVDSAYFARHFGRAQAHA